MFIAKAGVWAITTHGPCTHCGGPGGFAFALERTDQIEGSFCDPRCWGRWWDEHVQLTGTHRDIVPPTPWQPEGWRHAQNRWGANVADQPGITRHTRDRMQYLIYRELDGELVGFVRRHANGAIDVLVDPDKRGQGVGKALIRAAGREWGVNRAAQRITADGAAIVDRVDPAYQSET
jgi:GNAT superfamily N-acetyltransferase